MWVLWTQAQVNKYVYKLRVVSVAIGIVMLVLETQVVEGLNNIIWFKVAWYRILCTK